jgi:hypothetical protein
MARFCLPVGYHHDGFAGACEQRSANNCMRCTFPCLACEQETASTAWQPPVPSLPVRAYRSSYWQRDGRDREIALGLRECWW